MAHCRFLLVHGYGLFRNRIAIRAHATYNESFRGVSFLHAMLDRHSVQDEREIPL